MRAEIRNFRGIKSAVLDLTRLTLIAGVNYAGKSSIAHAVGAALTGELVPLNDVKKSEAGMLVHAGTGKASIDIETADGKINVIYPQAKMKTEGTPPAASLYAVGQRSVIEIPAKERASVLIEYLRAAPSDQDVLDGAKAIGLTDAQAAQLATKIKDLGWDGAHAHAKETGIKLKGQWEMVAGERYGPTKAESWLPANWDTDLEAASEDSLQAQLTQAREFLEAAIAASAISDDERSRLADWAGKVGALTASIDTATTARDVATSATTAALAALDALPRPANEEKHQNCPHCNKAVVVRGSVIAKHEPVSATENTKRAAARADAAKVHEAATVTQRDAEQALGALQTQLAAAEGAKKKLAALPAASTSSEMASDVEKAREGQAVAERRLISFKSKRDADRLHAGAQINASVQAMLAPDGLRLRKLREAVRAFNGQLAAMCATAGWGVVDFSDELAISYDGKPLALISASELFRVRVTIQAAMAELDRSAALVIDAADILDKNGRNGLMRLLLACGRPALVCMTLPTRADVPRMGERGKGYWIADGVALDVAAA